MVENRPGAGATLGARYVARAKPDGYTLPGGRQHHAFVGAVAVQERAVRSGDGFHRRSRASALLGQFLSTNPQQPFKTIQEMVAFAKANPGKLSYGHGNASAQIVGETIKYKLGLNIVRLPYSSNPTALTDLLSNSIQLMAIDYLNGVPLVESGRIVSLAGRHQGRAIRNCRTRRRCDETVIPGFEVLPWLGIFGPPNLPHDIVEQMSDALGKIVANEGFVQKPGEARTRALLPAERAVRGLREGRRSDLDRTRPDCRNRAAMIALTGITHRPDHRTRKQTPSSKDEQQERMGQ